jgi:hypothetical protein
MSRVLSKRCLHKCFFKEHSLKENPQPTGGNRYP